MFWMIRTFGTLAAALLGLIFGSFLNVCLSRWPEGERLVKPRSQCRSCDRTLAWWENLPLASWAARLGRCRGCGAWIGWRYPLVELAVAAVWAITAWQALPALYLPGWSRVSIFDALSFAVGKMLLYWLLVGLAVLDAEYLWLPDMLTLGGAALGCGFMIMRFAVHSSAALLHWTGGLVAHHQHMYNVIFRWLLGILIAPFFVLIIRWAYQFIRRREGIGLGDVKLMLLLAVWIGLGHTLLSFVLGVLLGIVVALVRLRSVARHRKVEDWALTKLPMGTFICVGGIVAGLWGDQIIAAYLRWANSRA